MSRIEDLPLHRGDSGTRPVVPPRPPASPSPSRWIIAGAAVVVVAAALALWWIIRTQPDTAVPTPTKTTEGVVVGRRPKPQALQLPSLDDSDHVIAGMIRALSQHPLIARLLASPGIVRQAVLVVQQVADGKTPAGPLGDLRPAARLAIIGDEQGRVDPRAYARWNAATAALVSINPADAARVYVNTKELFDAAYKDLGHPAADFDEAIVRAIQMLAATPPVTGDPELVRHPDRPGYFEHIDATLRAAQPVQKQFILIGPENRQRIMSWFKSLAAELDLKVD